MVCDYLHLHPVRAHLLRAEERLLSYPCSRLGWYLAAAVHRPGWLRVDRRLGEHGIGPDSAAGRLEFERRMAARRLAEADEAILAGLRRGGCFGSTEFRRERLEAIEKMAAESAGGGWRQEVASNKAERIGAEELKRLRWTERDLRHRRKSDPGKWQIAARLRRETILSLKSITARVGLGSSKSANTSRHAWMQADGKPCGADAEHKNQKTHAGKTNQTKA